MTKFDQALNEGRFIVSFCENCQKFVWPPSSYCNICQEITLWKEPNKNGRVLEFSKQKEDYFCLIEINNEIRILGGLETSKPPKIGQNVELYKCSYDEKPKFVFKPV